MPDITTWNTQPRTIPTIDLNARREAARQAREEAKRAQLAHFRAIDQAARDSLTRPVRRVTATGKPRTAARPDTWSQGPIRECAGTCGRPTRPRNTAAADAPGTVPRVLAGYCSACHPGDTNPHGVRPCTGPCGRLTRTRGLPPNYAPGTVVRLRDGMCSVCANGRPIDKGGPDVDALVADYQAGMSVVALKAKYRIGKSTLYQILERNGITRRRKVGRAA